MNKKILLYLTASAMAAVSCSKEEVTPIPLEAGGVSADILAVLKKHHATYSINTAPPAPGAKQAFGNAQELDSALTRFERSMRNLRLVALPKASPNPNSRIVYRAASRSFKVPVGTGMNPDNPPFDPNSTIDAQIPFSYCSGDGLFRSAEIHTVLSTTSTSAGTLEYVSSYMFAQAYTTQIQFFFGGKFISKMYGSGGGTNIIAQSEWSKEFQGSFDNSGLPAPDYDACLEPMPPTAPPVGGGSTGTGSGGSTGGSGAGGGDTGDGGGGWPQGLPTGGGGSGPIQNPTPVPEPNEPPPPPGPRQDQPPVV